MNIFEADFGLGPLVDVEDTILAGVGKLCERNRHDPGFDGLWMNEYGEILYGSLLVSAQAYCIGSLRDINKVRCGLGLSELTKEKAYKVHRVTVNNYSLIELVNSAANYFKHRDEWISPWPENYTTKVLTAFSMDCEFPINEVQQLIEAEYGYTRISNLVSEWRNDLIDQAKNES
ncbi:hypothetical protein DA096_08710 [Vibrio rotiferianus]|uniref:hypothetical protein n=1 Tax=Vibrio rotiferianus TaxID=190895 RepID=UPI00110FFB06|nr:hypothetical protein [Vibrio rotiferianus]TMX33841.1 hypothetical protein DA095_16290 [Vibrio rotiferianus]TMX55315.1 hypothetical protein DA093_08175 [Vibrio rotiferianus]TMX66261.1 hypothetical protein DA096_08710 [Vibrio rotiferianus]